MSKKTPPPRDSAPKPPPEAAFIGLPAKLSKLLETESDRGAILILAAYLDEILGLILRAACISDDAAESLLEWRKPAGDFDSKILLCHAFGHIHSEDVRALRAIQSVRNRAAHFDKKSGRGFDVLFDSSATSDQVAALADLFGIKLKNREPSTMRSAFIISCRFLASRLMLRMADVQPATPAHSAKEHASEARAHMKGTPLGATVDDLQAAVRTGDVAPILQLATVISGVLTEAPTEPAKLRTFLALQHTLMEMLAVAGVPVGASIASSERSK